MNRANVEGRFDATVDAARQTTVTANNRARCVAIVEFVVRV
jgi:hypothetical protein